MNSLLWQNNLVFNNRKTDINNFIGFIKFIIFTRLKGNKIGNKEHCLQLEEKKLGYELVLEKISKFWKLNNDEKLILKQSLLDEKITEEVIIYNLKLFVSKKSKEIYMKIISPYYWKNYHYINEVELIHFWYESELYILAYAIMEWFFHDDEKVRIWEICSLTPWCWNLKNFTGRYYVEDLLKYYYNRLFSDISISGII